MIFSFLLFNRYGTCVHYEEWNRTRKLNLDEMKHNMYGLIFEMKRFIVKTSPTKYPTLTPTAQHYGENKNKNKLKMIQLNLKIIKHFADDILFLIMYHSYGLQQDARVLLLHNQRL